MLQRVAIAQDHDKFDGSCPFLGTMDRKEIQSPLLNCASTRIVQLALCFLRKLISVLFGLLPLCTKYLGNILLTVGRIKRGLRPIEVYFFQAKLFVPNLRQERAGGGWVEHNFLLDKLFL